MDTRPGRFIRSLLGRTVERYGVLNTVLVLAVSLVLMGCGESNDRPPDEAPADLAGMLSTAEDLPGGFDLRTPTVVDDPFTCLPAAEETHGTYIELTNGRPFFSQYLMIYDSEELASGVIKDAQQLWARCTAVTWKVAPEPLDDPRLGDQSRALFVSVDCCTVVDPVAASQNGHLYTVFVRRGRLVEIISVITRDEGQFVTIATAADGKLGDRRW